MGIRRPAYLLSADCLQEPWSLALSCQKANTTVSLRMPHKTVILLKAANKRQRRIEWMMRSP